MLQAALPAVSADIASMNWRTITALVVYNHTTSSWSLTNLPLGPSLLDGVWSELARRLRAMLAGIVGNVATRRPVR